MDDISSTPEARLVKLVQGALKSTIDAHGAISAELIPSAVERICGDILALHSCVESALGATNSDKPSTEKDEASDKVTVPRPRTWATSRDIRPVIAKRRKPRPTPPLVS